MATRNSINSNIPIEISKGGTNATSLATTNGVTYYDGTSVVTTAAGTATHVLTSNGSGVAPTYQAAPAGVGNLIFIQSQTASSSVELDWTTGLNYKNYLMIIRGITVGVDPGQALSLQASTNSGSSYSTAGYQSGVNYVPIGATTVLTNLSSTANFVIVPTAGTVAAPGNVVLLYLYNFNSTGYFTYNVQGMYWQDSDSTNYNMWGGGYFTTSTVNAFRFVVLGGPPYTIKTGTFDLYGISL